MNRVMLDTCAVVDMLLDFVGHDKGLANIVDNPNITLCASFETMR